MGSTNEVIFSQTLRLLDLENEGTRVGPKINTSKTKVLSLTNRRTFPTCIKESSS